MGSETVVTKHSSFAGGFYLRSTQRPNVFRIKVIKKRTPGSLSADCKEGAKYKVTQVKLS